jgi:periplasmic protein TonB
MRASATVPLYTAAGCARTAGMDPKRFQNRVAATVPGPRVAAPCPRETPMALVWMLGTALCFLSVGMAGVARPVVDVAAHLSAAPPELPPEVPIIDLAAADLADTPDNEEPSAPEEPAPAPDSPPEPMLTAEDVVDVPPAPQIEPALRVPEPAPVKAASPEPRPRPVEQPRASSRPATAPARPAAAPAAPAGSGRAPATAAKGGGKGKFPKPPYPAFAKKQGLSGTVTISVRVGPDGSITSLSISGSSGSSQLDSYAASYLQSRWRWPAGEARSFRVPVRFNLR